MIEKPSLALVAAFLTMATAPPPAPMDRVEEAVRAGSLGEVKAVLIERGGEILYEQYFDGAGPDDRHDIRSAGKSFTALAIGTAMAEGAIGAVDEETPLAMLSDSRELAGITLRDVITMSSALDCNDWDEKSPGQEDRMYPKRDWKRHALAIPLKDDYTRDERGFGRFSYCTAGVFLTGQWLQQRTGERFDTYVQRRLFDPLAITDVKWKRSPSGEVQSGGQLEIRPRDLIKITRLVLDHGAVDGRQVVPAAWIDDMLTPYVRATDSDDYGYLWWLRGYRSREFATPGWYMLGNGGTTAVVFEELDASVVVVAANYNQPGMHQIARDIIERGALPLLLSGRDD